MQYVFLKIHILVHNPYKLKYRFTLPRLAQYEYWSHALSLNIKPVIVVNGSAEI
jgi:hypothetical protein